jgi:hypothetical protein
MTELTSKYISVWPGDDEFERIANQYLEAVKRGKARMEIDFDYGQIEELVCVADHLVFDGQREKARVAIRFAKAEFNRQIRAVEKCLGLLGHGFKERRLSIVK